MYINIYNHLKKVHTLYVKLPVLPIYLVKSLLLVWDEMQQNDGSNPFCELYKTITSGHYISKCRLMQIITLSSKISYSVTICQQNDVHSLPVRQ